MKLEIDDISEYHTFSSNDKILPEFYSIQEILSEPSSWFNVISILKR